MRIAREIVNLTRVNFLAEWQLWSKGWEGSNIGTTFTSKQKVAAYAAFTRGWREAMQDKDAWRRLTPRERVLLVRAKVREEIFNLPERQSIWGRIWKWTRLPA